MVSIINTKVVEFFGLPQTGKTTICNLIKKSLKEEGITSDVIIERASVCPIKDKLNPLFNYWTSIALMKEFIEACDKGPEILLADRGLLDSIIWVSYFNKDGQFQDEYMYFMRFMKNNFLFRQYISAYYFESNIEVILQREYEVPNRKNEGRIVNSTVLKGYSDQFNLIQESLIDYCPNILKIDTNGISVENIAQKVHQDLVNRL